MVQLQTFTTSDYSFKNNCSDNNKLQNRKKKRGNKYLILLNYAKIYLNSQNVF